MEDFFNPMTDVLMKKDEAEFTVSEISARIKVFVESNFGRVKVKGEIFGAKRADSGHWYLTLKDDNAALAAVIWRGVATNLSFKPEDGVEVVAWGKITTFAGKSSYQLVIEQMEPAGEGALLKLLEERKKKFAALGWFDIAHKKAIPYLPRTIGVVTSATGAVIRDIIHRVRDRFPSHILLIPTPVQGEGAAEKIAQAVYDFNRLDEISGYAKPDVLIIARGGGSLEDLWAFNEECVIKAVWESQIPVISAVGHETDTMLIDYVADKRAPTPTGAAEMAVPVKADLQVKVNNLANRLKNGILRLLADKTNCLNVWARGIPNLAQIWQEASQRFDDRIERLGVAFKNYLKDKAQQIEICNFRPQLWQKIFEKNQENLNNLWLRLSSVSVGSVLQRGFAIVKNIKGEVVYNAKQAEKAKELEVNFADGFVRVYTQFEGNGNRQKKTGKNKNEDMQISFFD
mgnify:CR=1 FL=1